MEELTNTVTQLVNQGKSPAIRRAKKPSQPKTQASSSESGSEPESEVSSGESCDPHKARPLPDVMYDFNAMEQADWAIRSWGLHFEHVTEAIAKLAERRLETQHSLRSGVTKRRGIRWCSSAHASPNWPLDETFDEDGVRKHYMHEQWTPLLDHEVDYEAMNYLGVMYPELLQQLVSGDSPVQFHMPEHLLENTLEWMVERMKMELHLSEARKAMRELDAVELLVVPQAANVIAELDWQQRH